MYSIRYTFIVEEVRIIAYNPVIAFKMYSAGDKVHSAGTSVNYELTAYILSATSRVIRHEKVHKWKLVHEELNSTPLD